MAHSGACDVSLLAAAQGEDALWEHSGASTCACRTQVNLCPPHIAPAPICEMSREGRTLRLGQ